MQSSRREKYLTIWNGFAPMHAVLDPLSYLELRAPVHLVEPMLDWLIKNKIQGKKFFEFYLTECKGSDLELLRVLTAKVKRAHLQPIIANKDIRL